MADHRAGDHWFCDVDGALPLPVFKEPRDERTCTTAPRFENGELVPSRTIPCENASIDSRRHEVERRAGEIDENVTYEPRDTGVGE